MLSELRGRPRLGTVLGVVGGVLILGSLLGTWLWQPRPLKRAREIGVIYEISPLRARVIEKGVLKSTFWFLDFSLSWGISLALMGIILGAVLGLISLGRWKLSLTGFFVYLLSALLFFYSFGRGLSIGVWTFIGWGLRIAILGGIVMFASAIVNFMAEEVD